LNHNKCYRKGSGCVKISVTEKRYGGSGDTTQHFGICSGNKGEVFESFKNGEGEDTG
jgi:hypothetical protein